MQALSPRDGRTLRYEWDVPDDPAFGLTARIGSQVLPKTSVAYGRLEARYRLTEWVHLQGHVGQAVTQERRGWAGGMSVGVSLDQIWR
jgi:hypothetical protein